MPCKRTHGESQQWGFRNWYVGRDRMSIREAQPSDMAEIMLGIDAASLMIRTSA